MRKIIIKIDYFYNIQGMYHGKRKTLFITFLGDIPKIRILDMLITGRELDYSISDIAALQ